MKKLFALILTAVFLCSTAYAAEIDLSGLSFAELLELQQRVIMAMWETDEWQEVTVPAGAYEIGKDIPAGHWTITPVDGQTARVCWGSKLDSSGTEIDYSDTLALEHITSPTDSYAKYNDVASVSWKLTDGSYLVIENASVVFTPFTGHSLGFK